MSKDYILERLQALNLIEKNQITEALLTQYSVSMPEDRFPVCELKLTGISKRYEADLVTLSVSIEGEKVKTAEIPVVSGECDNYKVTVGTEAGSRFRGRKAECFILAVDKYGRELVSSRGLVQFGQEKNEPVIKTEAEFSDTIEFDEEHLTGIFAKGMISSDSEASLCLELCDSEKTLWQNNILVSAEDSSDFEIVLDTAQVPADGDHRFEIRARYNGKIVFSKSADIKIKHIILPKPEPEEEKPQVKEEEKPTDAKPAVKSETTKIVPADIPDIVGDLALPDFVDVHTAVKDSVSIGSLLLYNRGSDSDVVISIILGGNNLFLSRVHLFEDEKEIELSAPFSTLAKEETYAREMVARVIDIEGNVILHKVVTLRIRSKFDMNLREIRLRTAQFVNPRNEYVERLIHDAEGPLAKAMKGNYSVYGYQHSGKNVVRQTRAIYDMLHTIGMKYVSDTFTFDKTKAHYQHVKTPDRVLSDKSGNCIELSIVFASLLEAMGLEAVVAFPPGHAIVGVVLKTDMYHSNSAYTEVEEIPYVSLEIDGKHADVMFVECTACPWDDDFVDAVCLAYESITKHQTTVSDNNNLVFLKKMRMLGIDPLLGM